jgi:hypothetical protein
VPVTWKSGASAPREAFRNQRGSMEKCVPLVAIRYNRFLLSISAASASVRSLDTWQKLPWVSFFRIPIVANKRAFPVISTFM